MEAAAKYDADEKEKYSECKVLELPENIYSCAFVLAQNATPGMYSFFPHKNRQMLVMWLYLSFIIFSQTLALLALTVIQPPMASSDEILVDCGDTTSLQFKTLSATHNFTTPIGCEAALPNVVLQLGDKAVRRATVEVSVFHNTFQADPLVVVLQLACCIWVLVHSYFSDFHNVSTLLQFRDFSRWFIVWKQEALRDNGWTLLIPLLQWALSTAVVSISWCLICGYSEPVDIVLNSMALTFINEIADVFAQPILKYYSETSINGLDPTVYGTDPIYYLVTEYDPANAMGCKRDGTWYVLKRDQTWYVLEPALTGEEITDMHYLPGTLTDFKIRMHPTEHCRPNDRAIERLRLMTFLTPPTMLGICWLATHGFLESPVSYCFATIKMALLIAVLSVDVDQPPRTQETPKNAVG